MRLQGKSIVVLGGTGGIGLSASRALLREGASLVVVGLDDAAGREARGQLLNEQTGQGQSAGAVELLLADARDSDTASRAIECATTRFGRFDGLYHVAGGSGRRHGDGPLHDVTDDGVDYTLRLNLNSVIFSNRAAVKYFLANQQAGVVLNLTSVLASHPSPIHFGTVAYAAAKAAIIGLTRSAASMYAAHNIRFNAIAAGLVDTPAASRAVSDPAITRYTRTKQPLDGGRPARPDDLDDAAIFLLSDESRFVTGQVLGVDGGWSVCEPDDSDF